MLAVALAIVGIRALLLRLEPGTGADRVIIPAVGAAAALEMGAVGIGTEDWRVAAILLAVAAALLTWMLSNVAIWPLSRRGGRKLRIVPAFILAVAFSGAGLTPYLERGEGSGGVTAFLRDLFGGSPSAGAEGEQPDGNADLYSRRGLPAPRAVEIGESYPAVILWPDVEPYTTLVSPLLVSGHTLFSGRAPDSYGIPFSGFYSFRRATIRPPKGHTSPTAIRTKWDFAPLTGVP